MVAAGLFYPLGRGVGGDAHPHTPQTRHNGGMTTAKQARNLKLFLVAFSLEKK